ncbi:MAG: protein jag [Helicobacteraceae bacterium]|nr:protein jag [Helicobacteraceae bacterium]
MVKIESITLESAYSEAAEKLSCSVTEINVEIIQHPSSGFLGLFKKSALIVATKKEGVTTSITTEVTEEIEIPKEEIKEKKKVEVKVDKQKEIKVKVPKESKKPFETRNDTIMPASFVTGQDDHEDELDYDSDENDIEIDDEDSPYRTGYTQVKSQIVDDFFNDDISPEDIVANVKVELNSLFKNLCFEINEITVEIHDENTLLVEFSGADAALLIGKEGYRYKALSYMIFNWINTKYNMQLRLEIAEFLKNQEENIMKYLDGVCENINKDGRAQTKILDGVLIQIALKELRNRYEDKYVAIRTTRDGNKYIIINDYNNY